MKLLVLLFIIFTEFEAKASKRRSNLVLETSELSSSKFNDFYSTDHSHESNRPINSNVQSKALADVKTNPMTNAFSSRSSENIDYLDRLNLNDNEREKVSINKRYEMLESLQKHKSDESATMRVSNDPKKDQTRMNSKKSHSELTAVNENNEKQKNRCDVSATNSRLRSYINLGYKIVKVYAQKDKNTAQGGEVARQMPEIDVTHDVFETMTSQSGLMDGIIYKVNCRILGSSDIIDFILKTTSDQNMQIGEFLIPPNTNKDNLKNKPSGSNDFSESFKKFNDCEKNLAYYEFNTNKTSESVVSWNWTMKNIPADSKVVEFRLIYRRANRRELFETSVTYKLLQDCSLTLKRNISWLDSSLINSNHQNCTFHFSTTMMRNRYRTYPPGLVIKLLRFNSGGCNNGGFLQFHESSQNNIKMCGKLEEFSENHRTIYFHSYTNVTLKTHKNPTFYIAFKFVDYCYNITLMNRNNLTLIQASDLTSKCHFKIHLPYGNRIAMRLQIDDGGNLSVNDNDNQENINIREIILTNSNISLTSTPTTTKTITSASEGSGRKNETRLDLNYLTFDDFSLFPDASFQSELFTCDDGFLIEVINRLSEKWNDCIKYSDAIKNVAYTLTTSDNVLFIRITIKKAQKDVAKKIFFRDEDTNEYKDGENMGPLIKLNYSAVPIEMIVSRCAFGWVLIGPFCVSVFNQVMSWKNAENHCNSNGGHLVSIRSESDQKFIDNLLLNCPNYQAQSSYWIGASDNDEEGDFRWIDGLPFIFSKWFPGWKQNENYNRQPNDDGLSEQDCVEIRRYFHRPASSGLALASFLTDSFMWNDRDCETKNPFICEYSLIEELTNNNEAKYCNDTIHLSQDKKKTMISSPSFPRFYPDDMNCVTFVTAPSGFSILIEFEEFVMEQEPQCAYDYLQLFEPYGDDVNVMSFIKHKKRSALSKNNLIVDVRNSLQNEHIYDEFLKDFTQQDTSTYILHPSNITYNKLISPPTNLAERIPRKICGDWNSKLKLLRYKSKGNLLGISFSSDYSHHFIGFKAKISLEKATTECSDERLKLFNDSCYLAVSFPEVEWVVAQKICHSMGAQLSFVLSYEEHKFIAEIIRSNEDYNPSSFYWLCAENSKSDDKWTDGSKMIFKGWITKPDKSMKSLCLAMQWKVTQMTTLPSNFYWIYQNCSNLGGYVCKKSGKNDELMQNQTIRGMEGRLTSPSYPNHYTPSLNYWVHIIAPEKTRIILQFQKIDVESQQECLYDYVSVQDVELRNESDGVKRNVRKSENVDYQMLHRFSSTNNNEIASPSFQQYVRWCGSYSANMSRFDFISKSNELFLNFVSDYSMSGEGFSAIWRSIDVSACPGQTMTAHEGILTSPNFPNFLLHNLSCTFTIQAPIGRKIWIEFTSHSILSDAVVYVDLGDGIRIQPFSNNQLISDGVFLSRGETLQIILRTEQNPRGKGFSLKFRSVQQPVEHRIMNFSNVTFGQLHHLNFPLSLPKFFDFTQYLIAPVGNVISIELYGMEFGEHDCADGSSVQIHDKYAETNGTIWRLCSAMSNGKSLNRRETGSVIIITSYLNTLHIRQKSLDNDIGLLNASIRVQSDLNYKLKLISTTDDWVEACHPNPCQFGGKCITSSKKQVCQCNGHFTGRFCALNMCELDPCIFGQCTLTNSSFKVLKYNFDIRMNDLFHVFEQCNCQPGYQGKTCEQRTKPCNEHPCKDRGECVEKNDGFTCRCFAWFEGPRCEKRMQVPYRPLSERMLQEPFWLGLITVFVVLAVIGLVWCAKRHFPEKIEKLLQEEADRNRPAHLRHHHHISLREQLQVAGAANNPMMQAGASQINVTTMGTQKSIFGRLGIRKPSLLSLSSPQPSQGSTARTFSLDDLLRPLPRPITSNLPNENYSSKENNLNIGSPSPRKKRNNSTPTPKNAAEKTQILQHLISANSSSNKVTLGELIQFSDRSCDNHIITAEDGSGLKETAFQNESITSVDIPVPPLRALTRQLSSDPKLEKKVTFARLLSKMSAEINSSNNIDGNSRSSAISLPTEVQLRANSVPPSPCTNDIRSPHSTSSNQGSDSLSSSELALHDFSFRNNQRKHRTKVSSADSILAMFKNFTSSNSGINNLSTSLMISPSTTPTATSPLDDNACDDESSTSSILTPVSASSGAPDSPIYFRTNTVEVTVMDAMSAHKTTQAQTLLHPPSILLEIPGNINKCLSPIRELPTPALTPVMSRPHRTLSGAPDMQDETLSVTLNDDDDTKHNQTNLYHDHHVNNQQSPTIAIESNQRDSDNDSYSLNKKTSSEESSTNSSVKRSNFASVPLISIDSSALNNAMSHEKMLASRPKDLIIPELVVQTPSPTKERYPVIVFPGSPPPTKRASIGDTSGMFPNKQQQKRLLMHMEKPGSLDIPTPPVITVNMCSEAESDTEFLSPVTLKPSLLMPTKFIPSSTGMVYLSPFTCARDRAPSEGNLSSSGYSSMASPCGSSSKLCASEGDEMKPRRDFQVTLNNVRLQQSIMMKNDPEHNADCFRKRSDSETFSDEILLESNDEGIGTDQLDEKLEESDIKSAKDLEVFIGKELLDHGKSLLNSEEIVGMSQLQLPSIIVHSDNNCDKLSPVSSRSESPLSDRNNGMGRFSPQFYGKKDSQLPFTDSDGLYDFPSSDGKGGSTGSLTQHRKNTGKRRERRCSKSNILPPSSSTNLLHLEIPGKVSAPSSSSSSPKYHPTRKNLKRRPLQRYTPSSSSSTESLTTSYSKETSVATVKMRSDCETNDNANEIDTMEIHENVVKNNKVTQAKKINRMKAVGHQIKFIYRLEHALKKRKQLQSESDDETGNEAGSPKATSPLLSTESEKMKRKPSRFAFLRQKKLLFESGRDMFKEHDYSSD
ncbi:CLUMA_CG004883, isoform A [Clunio marinus]|uniref:CLUMA_CG004883, isoform A n=1 Tax=Clunio marinus TaxID=568069 RepID=A0A1J1HT07_9DIPT|nr:CLUMA_CG004883, isoform A [Clunio marinus]